MPATGGRSSRAACADLIGYYAPHEGSATTAYGVYNIENLAAYETYRARPRGTPEGRANYDFSKREGFIRREEHIFPAPSARAACGVVRM